VSILTNDKRGKSKGFGEYKEKQRKSKIYLNVDAKKN